MLWKVTITTVSLSGLTILLSAYKPHVQVRYYRWRWRAKLVAFFANIPALGVPMVQWAKVEPYWPGSNVVSIKIAA